MSLDCLDADTLKTFQQLINDQLLRQSEIGKAKKSMVNFDVNLTSPSSTLGSKRHDKSPVNTSKKVQARRKHLPNIMKHGPNVRINQELKSLGGLQDLLATDIENTTSWRGRMTHLDSVSTMGSRSTIGSLNNFSIEKNAYPLSRSTSKRVSVIIPSDQIQQLNQTSISESPTMKLSSPQKKFSQPHNYGAYKSTKTSRFDFRDSSINVTRNVQEWRWKKRGIRP